MEVAVGREDVEFILGLLLVLELSLVRWLSRWAGVAYVSSKGPGSGGLVGVGGGVV